MNCVFIKNTNDKYFKEAFEIYNYSFPLEEKRTLEEHRIVLQEQNYCMSCYLEDEKVVAILFFWKLDSNHTFLEHLAISKELQGKSYGSKILEDFIKNNQNIVLEIEPISDETTKRRQSFYERFDFVTNEHEHFQIPFRKEDEELKLLLMSHKKYLSKDEYEKFYESLKKSLKKF